MWGYKKRHKELIKNQETLRVNIENVIHRIKHIENIILHRFDVIEKQLLDKPDKIEILQPKDEKPFELFEVGKSYNDYLILNKDNNQYHIMDNKNPTQDFDLLSEIEVAKLIQTRFEEIKEQEFKTKLLKQQQDNLDNSNNTEI